MHIDTLSKVTQHDVYRTQQQPDFSSMGSTTLTDSSGNNFGFLLPTPFWRNDGYERTTEESKAEAQAIYNADNAAGIVFRIFDTGNTGRSPDINFFDIHDKTYHSAYYYTETTGGTYPKVSLHIHRSEHEDKQPQGSTRVDSVYLMSYDTRYASGKIQVDMYLLGGPAFNPFTKKWDILFAPAFHILKEHDLGYNAEPCNKRMLPYNFYTNIDRIPEGPSFYQSSDVIIQNFSNTNPYVVLNPGLSDFTPYGRTIYTREEEPTNNLFSYFVDATLSPSKIGSFNNMKNQGSYTSAIQYDVDV